MLRGLRHALGLAALGALTWLAYAQSLAWTYVADDYTLLAATNTWRGKPRWDAIARFFLEPLPKQVTARFYRPLWRSSYALDGALGLDPRVSHALELGLFTCLVWLVYALGRALALPVRAAWLAAAFVALSPTPIEAVVWVAARTDLLAVGGVVAGWMCAARLATGARIWPWQLGLGVSALVAYTSKESGLVLGPGAFLIVAAFARPTWRGGMVVAVRRTAWLAVATLGFLAWRAHLVGSWLGGYSDRQGALTFSAWLEGKALTVRAFAFPLGDPLLSRLPPSLAAALAVGLLVGLTFLVRRRSYAVALLLCLLGFLPIYEIDVASWKYPGTRQLLLPSIGLALALALVANLLRQPKAFWLVATALLLFAGFVQRGRFAPYAEASVAMQTLRGQLAEVLAARADRPLFLHGLPERYGPAVCALNAFPAAMSPPLTARPVPHDARFLLDTNTAYGRLDLATLRLMLDPNLAELGWSRTDGRLVEQPFRFAVLVLKGEWELGEQEGALHVGGIEVTGIQDLAAFELPEERFIEIRLGALGPSSEQHSERYVVRDLRPSQPVFAEPRAGLERYRLVDELEPEGVGLLVGSAPALRPFSLGGALLIADPVLLRCARDPETGAWSVPPGQRKTLDDARYAQAFYPTPDGIAFSERIALAP